MKERVTLTLNPAVTHCGKLAARTHGISFSGFVESLLASATGLREPADRSFASKWAGQFKLADLEGPRGKYLQRKYNL